MAMDMLNGAWVGHSFNTFRSTEESYRAGNNRFGTTLGQIACVNNALYQSSAAMAAGGVEGELSLVVKGLCYLTPVLTNFLASKFNLKESPYLKKCINFFKDYMSDLCQIAIVISSIALIAFGQPLMGWVTLGFLAFSALQRQTCFSMPLYASKSVNTVGFFLSNFARLVFGDVFSKVTGVIDITASLYDWMYPIKHEKTQKPDFRNISVTIDQAEKMHHVEIDPLHYTYRNPLPPIPDVDLSLITDAFNAIGWKKEGNFAKLKQVVTTDDHWIEYYSHQDSDRELYAYVEKGITNYVHNLKHHTIRKGEILSYTSLEAKSKCIANELRKLPEEQRRVHLLNLALASYYCPGGYARELNQIYKAISGHYEEDALPHIVNRRLTFMRTWHFQQFLAALEKGQPGPMKHFIDPADIHNYNLFSNIMKNLFHLSEGGDGTEDPLSFITTFERMLFERIYTSITKPFVDQYSIESIRENMREALKDRDISFDKIKTFFTSEYLETLKMDRVTTEIKREAENWVREHVFDEMTGEIKTAYLDYFLVRLGIFKPST